MMEQLSNSSLSKNQLRRMHGWGRAVYPGEWLDRCSAAAEYLARLSPDEAESLVRQGWPEVFAAAERDRTTPVESA